MPAAADSNVLDLLPPTPEMQPVNVQPAQAPGGGNYGYGAGFMGKAGNIAAIAAPVVEGWMQGKWIKEDREQKDARNKAAGARSLFAMSVEGYRNWMENHPDATDQEKAHRLEAVKQARDAYAGVMEQYVTPEGKAKGVGGRIKAGAKKALGAPTPEMFAQGMVNAFKNQPLEDLVAPDVMRKLQIEREKTGIEGEKAGIEASKAQTEAAKSEQKARDFDLQQKQRLDRERQEYSTLVSKSTSGPMTPEDSKRLDELGADLGEDYTKRVSSTLVSQMAAGKPLSPEQRNLGINLGIINPGSTSYQVLANGHIGVIHTTADGKTSIQDSGAKAYIAPTDPGGLAQQVTAMAQIEKKIAKEKEGKEISDGEALARAKANFSRSNAQTGWKSPRSVDSALHDASGTLFNELSTEDKKIFLLMFDGKSGHYEERDRLPDVDSSGKYVGVPADSIRKALPSFSARLKEVMAKQGIPDDQADLAVDAITEKFATQIQEQSQAGRQNQGPPKSYKVTGPGGKTFNRDLTDAEKQMAISNGFKVEEQGGKSLTPPPGGGPVSRPGSP